MCTDIAAKKGMPRTSQVNTGVSPVALTLGAVDFRSLRFATSGGILITYLSGQTQRSQQSGWLVAHLQSPEWY